MQFNANAPKSNGARDSVLQALGYNVADATVTLGRAEAVKAVGREGEQVFLAVLLNSTEVSLKRAANFAAEKLMKKARDTLYKSQVVCIQLRSWHLSPSH